MKLQGVFCALALVALLSSCTKDDEKTVIPSAGKYKLTSLKSNLVMDLNHDGVESYDMMYEIPSYFTSEKPDLEIVDGNVTYASFVLPHYESDVFFRGEINCKIRSIDNQTFVLDTSEPSAQYYYTTQGRPMSLETTGVNKLKAVIYKEYFDHSVQMWRYATVTGEYVKM